MQHWSRITICARQSFHLIYKLLLKHDLVQSFEVLDVFDWFFTSYKRKTNSRVMLCGRTAHKFSHKVINLTSIVVAQWML